MEIIKMVTKENFHKLCDRVERNNNLAQTAYNRINQLKDTNERLENDINLLRTRIRKVEDERGNTNG